jgi:hypothetical protein
MSRELIQLTLDALKQLLAEYSYQESIGNISTDRYEKRNAERVVELLKAGLAKLEPEPETTKDPRFTCAKCGSEDVKVAPMYGSVSRCCDCGHKWSNP